MKSPAIFALLSIMALHGCSGDGGSASTTPPTPASNPNLSVPVRIAVANIVQHGFNQPFTISGSVNNSTPSNSAPPVPLTEAGVWFKDPPLQPRCARSRYRPLPKL